RVRAGHHHVGHCDSGLGRRHASRMGPHTVRSGSDVVIAMHRSVAMLALVAVLASCAGVDPSIPYVAHPPTVETSQTAVLISMDRQTGPRFLATIRKIDGQDVVCHWDYGCPIWARVAAGDHEVTVRYQNEVLAAVSPTLTRSERTFAE